MRCGARLLCILLLGACTTTPQTDPTTIDEGWMRNAEGQPPNILMISIDTMRHDHTGWTGRWNDSFTPHLDEFARQAVIRHHSTPFGWHTEVWSIATWPTRLLHEPNPPRVDPARERRR